MSATVNYSARRSFEYTTSPVPRTSLEREKSVTNSAIQIATRAACLSTFGNVVDGVSSPKRRSYERTTVIVPRMPLGTAKSVAIMPIQLGSATANTKRSFSIIKTPYPAELIDAVDILDTVSYLGKT